MSFEYSNLGLLDLKLKLLLIKRRPNKELHFYPAEVYSNEQCFLKLNVGYIYISK